MNITQFLQSFTLLTASKTLYNCVKLIKLNGLMD